MPRILLVKTSSMGDVAHNLPVVSDIHAHVRSATVDWVVEEAFAAIPRMHPGVANVIPVAPRRWRRSLFSADTRAAWREYRTRVREAAYDAVIDTQGLVKSALLAHAARGMRHGLDWSSSREPLRCFYDHTYNVPWGQHAVARNRALAGLALGYQPDASINFGIHAPAQALPWLPHKRYAVLLHATSAERKLWPEALWTDLCKYMFLKEFFSVLPWGNTTEQARSERLARAVQGAVVPPALAIDALATLLARAQCVIGVDTGLLHLAAALGTPTVGIYVDTDPAATGVYGCERAINLGSIGKPPSVAQVIDALHELEVLD